MHGRGRRGWVLLMAPRKDTVMGDISWLTNLPFLSSLSKKKQSMGQGGAALWTCVETHICAGQAVNCGD